MQILETGAFGSLGPLLEVLGMFLVYVLVCSFVELIIVGVTVTTLPIPERTFNLHAQSVYILESSPIWQLTAVATNAMRGSGSGLNSPL